MRLILDRFYSDADATVGNLLALGSGWQCFIVEDEYREAKVLHETRIPAGAYKLGLRGHGGFYEKYTRLYHWHKEMIEVLNVPGFTDILIHPGNTDDDTSGCLLPNYGVSCYQGVKGSSSVPAYTALYSLIYPAVKRGECSLTVINNDLSLKKEVTWG